MSGLSPRMVTVAKWSAVPVALVISGLVVSQASYSAFSATTSNPTNNWNAGTVALSDDAGTPKAAMFTASNLKPGSTGSKCIAVTSSGSLDSAVKLYATSPVNATNDLANHLNLTITQGTGGGFGSCSGFTALQTNAAVYSGTLADFAANVTGFGNGKGTWAPTGGVSDTRIFQITYTVDTATTNASQGLSTGVGFTWEAQNTAP